MAVAGRVDGERTISAEFTDQVLRERPEDIPLLVKNVAAKYGAKLGKRFETIPKPTMEALRAYAWPGNVRELEHVIERGVDSQPKRATRAGRVATPTRGPGARGGHPDAGRAGAEPHHHRAGADGVAGER